ncbi:MAG: TlyA family RNA methyltransferase [Proteobacteria bacterium]|nr:TlyA family RNA methyltransferase [Pseudomonadota bacterium]
MVKERIDVLLAKKGLAPSREKAKILIMAGEVYAGNERITRPDRKIGDDAPIEVKKNPIPYVSYGGIKLEKAIEAFSIDVKGKKVIDIGSSTGGFIDCLLQHGASIVYAVDVGTHQLHEHLRTDKRVIVKENLNARYLTFEDIGEQVDIITIDVSFISLKMILPVTIPLLSNNGHVVSLVKPQFEVGRFEVGKGGIVKDVEKIKRAIEDIKLFGMGLGLKPTSEIEAPRAKEKKNREYFISWEL